MSLIIHSSSAALTQSDGVRVDPRLLLRNIGKAVGEALVLASSDGVEGEIRWSEVACPEVELASANPEDPTFRCMISGAAPDNDELHGYVASYVYCKMGVSVTVATQW